MQCHSCIYLFGYRIAKPLLSQLECNLHRMIYMNRNDFIQHSFTSGFFDLVAEGLDIGFNIGAHMTVDIRIIKAPCLIILKPPIHFLINIQKLSVIVFQLCFLIINEDLLIMHGQKIIDLLLLAGI